MRTCLQIWHCKTTQSGVLKVNLIEYYFGLVSA
jgi:hypothetical protein